LALFPYLRPLLAQQPPPPAGQITITVLEGEGGVNNINKPAVQNLIVQVQDEKSQPVAGADVVFNLPAQGAGGAFPDGSKVLMTRTDDQGRAVARGFKPNNATGKIEIPVSASIAGRTAKAVITQFNMDVRSEGGRGGKIAAIVVVLGAAAAAGVVVSLRKQTNSGPQAPPPISVTPGGGTVTTPQ
jgi:hypothetical protein